MRNEYSRENECIKEPGHRGEVLLVGAGCGPGLITVRGLRAIRKAEVLLYDELLDKDLLIEAPPGCELISCGKRMGRPHPDQEEINALLVEKARSGRRVVRLKGGDSFVFGRGGEEILALQEAEIPYGVIPGVSSGAAVPEEAGLPVTHRGLARSVTFITGHRAEAGKQEEKWEALAGLEGTLVFFMAASRIREIAGKLMDVGKAPGTPASVISQGCSALSQRVDGSLADIADRAEGLPAPTLLVVGETAGMHLESTLGLPLERTTVTVTGTRSFVRKAGELLRAYGAEVHACPCLKVIPQPEEVPASLEGYSWAVFTSENGVEQFFAALRDRGTDRRVLSGLKFACLGSGTKAKLADYGYYADLVPRAYTARDLGRALAEAAGEAAEKILILRARDGSADLTAELERAGVPCRDCSIYRTEAEGTFLSDRSGGSDYLVFGSAKGVEAYLSYATIPPETVPVCIGPSALRALEGNAREALCPQEHSVPGIVETILRDVQMKMK